MSLRLKLIVEDVWESVRIPLAALVFKFEVLLPGCLTAKLKKDYVIGSLFKRKQRLETSFLVPIQICSYLCLSVSNVNLPTPNEA